MFSTRFRALLRKASLLALLIIILLRASSVVHAATYSVTITDTAFVPATLQAAVGDTVTFLNTSTATQSAKSSVASGFNTGDIGPGSSKSVVLVNEGSFTYGSLYNPALTGTIIVGASTGSLTDTTSTVSARTTTTTTTQAQPVTGSTEVFFVLIAVGGSLLVVGAISSGNLPFVRSHSSITELPLVSSDHGPKDQE